MIAALLALATALAPAPVRCGAVARPGVAERGADGMWHGAAADLCRRIAQSAGAPVAFHSYVTIADLRKARHDTLAVLSRDELAIAMPASSPSRPPVTISRQLLLVRPGTPLHGPSELAGQRVCFIVASAAEAALNAWSRATHIAILRVGFQEAVELRDGFDSGYCAAMAADADDIPGGADHTHAIGPPLTEVDLFAVRPN